MRKIYTMYASALIRNLVCDDCENKPCPYKSWLQKNACTKIVSYNEKIGKCCATCLYCMWGEYCSERVKGNKDVDPNDYLINWDIFEHVCDDWTNTWEEVEP